MPANTNAKEASQLNREVPLLPVSASKLPLHLRHLVLHEVDKIGAADHGARSSPASEGSLILVFATVTQLVRLTLPYRDPSALIEASSWDANWPQSMCNASRHPSTAP